MDRMTFVSTLTGQLAWPITTVILVSLLKKHIGKLLPRIESFKHNKTEIGFAKTIDVVVEKAENAEETGRPLSLDLKKEEERLLSKIDISPHSVIHQSYAIIERELLELYDSQLTGDERRALKVRDAREIRKSLGFGAELEQSIAELKKIRRHIMVYRKLEEHDITSEQIRSYLELALDCTAQVKEFIANKAIKQD